jgi:hypothetical protein
MGQIQRLNGLYRQLLSANAKARGERFILSIAIVSYLAHLLLILLSGSQWLSLDSDLFSSPIAAIYTPFSFILIYEVYLLIFFLPQSISSYIGKQYEIITLIVIRRIFKDIGNLELTSDWFQSNSDLQFTYDALTTLILFLLLYFFYRSARRTHGDGKTVERSDRQKTKIQMFILLKKAIALLLVPMLLFLAFYTFSEWALSIWKDYEDGIVAFKDINNVFFDEFFTVMIIVDVLLLLASFFYSDRFHEIIRNSGFVISTILLKISFSTEGIVSNALIIGAVLFGLLILLIYNRFELLGARRMPSDPGD